MGLTCSTHEGCAYGILVENLEIRDNFGDLGSNERIILKLVLKEFDVMVGIGFIWLNMSLGGLL
jgi:hypothetical protein